MKIKNISILNLGIGSISILPFLYSSFYAQSLSGLEEIPLSAIACIHRCIWWGIGVLAVGMLIETAYEKGIPLRGFILLFYLTLSMSVYRSIYIMWALSLGMLLYDLYALRGTVSLQFSSIGIGIMLSSYYATSDIVALQMLTTGASLLLFSHLLLIPHLDESATLDREEALTPLRNIISHRYILWWTFLIPLAFITDMAPKTLKGISSLIWLIAISLFVFYLLTWHVYLFIFSHKAGFYTLLGTLIFLFSIFYRIHMKGHPIVAAGISILGIAIIYRGMAMFSSITSRYILVSADILGGGLLLITLRWIILTGDLYTNMLYQMPMETMFTSAILNMVGIGMVISGLINMGEKLPTPAEGGNKDA